jgi:hypothetical protein
MWPYLLGHYRFGSSPEDRQELDLATQQSYETTMSEWLAVEAIVRQRDKETMAANLAKLSSESTSGDVPPPTPAMAQDLSNDVSYCLLKNIMFCIFSENSIAFILRMRCFIISS